MLAALEAAQSVGGDIRGKQSAAIVVVRAKATDKPWTDRLVDLRVEDSDRFLAEIRRVLGLARAYDLMNQGDEAVAAGKMDDALAKYSRAEAMFPGNDEFVFWHAVTLVTNGRTDEALPVFAKAFRMNPSWMLLVPRLPGGWTSLSVQRQPAVVLVEGQRRRVDVQLRYEQVDRGYRLSFQASRRIPRLSVRMGPFAEGAPVALSGLRGRRELVDRDGQRWLYLALRDADSLDVTAHVKAGRGRSG
jgi:tetratricopeptide (TPR) repeat protein